MPLNRRLWVLLALGFTVLWLAFYGVLWLGTSVYHFNAMQHKQHGVAGHWTYLLAKYEARLTTQMDALLADAAVQTALHAPAVPTATDPALTLDALQQAAARLGLAELAVFDREGQPLLPPPASPASLRMVLSPVWVQRWVAALASPASHQRFGLVQVEAQQYRFVSVRALTDGAGWVVAISMDSTPVLTELAQLVEGELALFNLLGERAAETAPFSAPNGLILNKTHTVMEILPHAAWHYLSEPVKGLYGATQGVLLARFDVQSSRTAEQRFLRYALLGSFFLLLGIGGLIGWLAHPALRVLHHATALLNQQAARQAEALLEGPQEVNENEARHHAHALLALKKALSKLALPESSHLREQRQHDEQLHRQIATLSIGLHNDVREDILTGLEKIFELARCTHDTHSLHALSALLGRMTSLIGNQHSRLLAMLQKLRESEVRTQGDVPSAQASLEMAQKVQRSLLPLVFPSYPQLEVTARMVQVREVGGAFYDVFSLDKDRLAVVMADVSGKGVSAVFFMAVTRTLLRAYAPLFQDPAACLTRLNALLCQDNNQMLFSTLFYGVLHLDSGRFEYANAGHPAPVHCSAAGSRYADEGQGMALAVLPHTIFSHHTFTLAAGDCLLLYSDGITEAINPYGQRFGRDRLIRSVRAASPLPALLDQLIRTVHQFTDTAHQADDMACLLIRYSPVPSAPHTRH